MSIMNKHKIHFQDLFQLRCKSYIISIENDKKNP